MKGLSSEGTFSAKEQAELDRKVAKVGNKELAGLDAKARLELEKNTNSMANDIGVRTAAEGAAAFDANVLAQLNAADMMMDSSLNKRLGAVDGYLNMSRKTQRDIQAIDSKVETNRQQRAFQASKIQQRYDQKLMDFRMDNPVYRTPEPLFDYDSALAADNAMWGEGKRRAQLVQQAKDVFVQSYEKGEFTAAWGMTGGVEAGAGADGAFGKYLSVNFKSGTVSLGLYGSLELASNLNIPMPEAHVGGEFTFYPTSKFGDALKGQYIIYGGNVDAKAVNVSAGLVKTNNNQLTGFQLAAVGTTPNLAKLPGHSGFVRAGVGNVIELASFNYKNWW